MRALALLLVLPLAGCLGSSGEVVDGPVSVTSVTFEMSPDANGRWPARVAVVQTPDPVLTDKLLAISPSEWFSGMREKFESAHPGAYYDAWEIVPGLVAGPFPLRVEGYVTPVLFCDTDASTATMRIAYDGDIAVHIDSGGCTVYPIL